MKSSTAIKSSSERVAVQKPGSGKAAPENAAPERAAPATAVPEKAVTKKVVSDKAVTENAVSEQAPTKSPARLAPAPKPPPPPPPKPVVLDEKFLEEQKTLLLSDRTTYLEQAEALRAEAEALARDAEPGDIQFDDESGEGGTVNVDRERDLALSAQARAEVEEIDHALAKIQAKTYGACERCGTAIPRLRLKALPHARLCVDCKSGGLSRR